MSRINVDKITGKTGTNSGAPITLSGDTATLGSGVTISDSVVMTNKYYLQLDSGGSYGAISSEMVNNSGTTVPYFANATGDTTNIVAVNNHDYKLVRAGIYLIIFTVSAYESSSGSERGFSVRIRHNASSPTSSEGTDELSKNSGQVANVDDSAADYGGATTQVIHNFSANHLINFYITELSSAFVDRMTASIVLIRPV